MFLTIFTSKISRLGKHTSPEGGILCMAIVGGAVITVLQRILANNIGIQQSFFRPVICYAYVAYYGLKRDIPITKTETL